MNWPPEIGIEPYYADDRVVIYCADCRDVLPKLSVANAVVTDPPYGIEGGRGGDRAFRKAAYDSSFWTDTRDYVREAVVPAVRTCIDKFGRVCVTPGIRCMWDYPEPVGVGCFWLPAAATHGPWGFTCFTPILFYGRDPRSGIGQLPSGIQVVEASEKNGHPCPKPIEAWKWLINKATGPNEIVLDPFAGSCTTAVAAKQLGLFAVCIELEERYCEIGAQRCRQGVLW